jgi:hypothetical protein
MAEHIRASMKESLDHYDQQRAAAEADAVPLDLPDDMMSEYQRRERNARPRKSQRTRAA